MPDAIWIDRDDELPALARELEAQPWLGIDTEFLRERTFFPKLCLLQISAGTGIWCVDALRVDLAALVPTLTAAGRMSRRPASAFARSSTSLMRESKCSPFRLMRSSDSRARGLRFSFDEVVKRSAKPRMALSGVRSSWLMDARNSVFTLFARFKVSPWSASMTLFSMRRSCVHAF